jgi:hypothetical protein
MAPNDFPVVNTPKRLRDCAAVGERLHFTGIVENCGDGYSGTYRQRWLHIRTRAGLVRVTASPKSPLGRAQPGAAIELAATLTGLVDLKENLFYAEHARVVSIEASG